MTTVLVPRLSESRLNERTFIQWTYGDDRGSESATRTNHCALILSNDKRPFRYTPSVPLLRHDAPPVNDRTCSSSPAFAPRPPASRVNFTCDPSPCGSSGSPSFIVLSVRTSQATWAPVKLALAAYSPHAAGRGGASRTSAILAELEPPSAQRRTPSTASSPRGARSTPARDTTTAKGQERAPGGARR